MGQFSHYDSESGDTNPFCEDNNAPLHVLVPYQPAEEDYTSPPNAALHLFEPLQQPAAPPPAKSSTQLRAFRALFYFAVALPITLLGLLILCTTFGSDTRTVAIALFFMLGILSTSMMIYFRMRTHKPRLQKTTFLLLLVVATFTSFLLFCLQIAFIPDIPHSSAALKLSTGITGGIIMCYGFLLQMIALL
ncbi:MAG: hypothetical protein IMW89_10400 [Ktedonobacteraceae bacterium]|nr:hypothetical protein [Ktedonobacteraceae bacterium]